MSLRPALPTLLLALLLAGNSVAHAEATVEVRDAWVRPSYALPSSTGAYMTLVASGPLRLTGASSDAARSAEISSTRLADGVMLMDSEPGGLELPAGQPVVLQPGQHLIILAGLKGPLHSGATVTLRLEFTDTAGHKSYQDLRAPVRTAPPGQAEQHHHH